MIYSKLWYGILLDLNKNNIFNSKLDIMKHNNVFFLAFRVFKGVLFLKIKNK